MAGSKIESRRLRRSTRQKTIGYDALTVIDVDNDDDSDSELINKTSNKRMKRNDIHEESDPEEIENSDENDYFPNNNKRRKGNQQTKGSNRKKKHHHNKKNMETVSNIDDIENYVENPIFESLSSDIYSPANLAQSWIDDFTTEDLNTKFDALKDFINFVLRCSGCIVQLNRHDVTNTENAKETINEIQSLFARQKYHEFPMMYAPVNNKDWKEFPDNAISFISQIIVIAGETGILYEENGEFIELLLEWISAMSTSNIRALRYVSTLFGLTIQSVLCKFSVNISKFIDKFLRQLKKENESLKALVENKSNSNRQLKRQVDSSNDRIKVIEDNLEMYKKQKKEVDSYISDFFNALFVHRYRDVASEIRLKCVNYLGNWMEEYPEMFFESAYLRYFGWLLTDQDSNIRCEVFKVLIKLYKKRSTVAALRQFTLYFKNKLIEIVIYETDFNARSHCLQVLIEIIEKGYLSDDDIIQITSLIFIDDEDLIYPFQGSKLNPTRFFKEIAQFISKVENLNTLENLERDQIQLETLTNELSLNCGKALKIKNLLNILSDSYEYYQSTYATSNIKNNLANSKIEKLTKIFQYLYQLKTYNDNNSTFEFLINYVNFDFSAYDIPTVIKDNLELDSKLQSYLLNFINSITLIYSQGMDNIFYKSLFPTSNKSKIGNANVENDNDYYLLKVLPKLSNICEYFHNDIEKISILVNLTANLLKNGKTDIDKRSLKHTINQFIRFFSNINFPLRTQSREDSKYFNSITYQYIALFKLIKVEELEITSQFDSIFTETSVSLNSKVDENKNIIDALNKFYILSYCSYLTDKSIKNFSKYLPIYSNSLYYQLDHDDRFIPPNDVLDLSLSVTDDISSFLHISNYYINKSLSQIFKRKSQNNYQNIDLHPYSEIINSINSIQRSISLLILPDESKLSVDLVNEISITYLNNVICISAFKAEFGSLSTTDNNISEAETDEIQTLRSHIGKSIQKQLIKLFCIREFQVAELLGTDNALEREADEDVNFTTYSVKYDDGNNDKEYDEEEEEEEREENEENSQVKFKILKKKLEKYEILLCEIASKLVLCCNIELIDDENDRDIVINRVNLNASVLGELYKRVLSAVGGLLNIDNESTDKNIKGVEKQQTLFDESGKLTDMAKHFKKRKLIETETLTDQENDIGEDENDPIENVLSDSDSDDNIQNEEEIEFSSDSEEDEVQEEEDEAEEEGGDSIVTTPSSNKRRKVTSSEISSLASSFPFTQ